VALTRTRTGSFRISKAIVDRILGRGDISAAVVLTHVDPERFYHSIELFETYRDHPLSFTDSTTISIMNARLLSFDTDFDGLVDRLDPGDVEN